MEQRLIGLIALYEEERATIKERYAEVKSQLTAVEDELITVNIRLDRLRTQLREVQMNADTEDEGRLRQIQEFRRKYPELCK